MPSPQSPGQPALDLLAGGAVEFAGGRRRHEIEFQAGAFKWGLGARLTATWRSGTRVTGLGADAEDLLFDDLATVNLSLFANLVDQFGGTQAPGWAKGARVTLGINNPFNERPTIGDRASNTPLSYQPTYLDPLGRTLSFSLRKVF